MSSAGLYFLYFFSGGSDSYICTFVFVFDLSLYLTFAEYMCVLHWHLQKLNDANKIANATLGTILSTGGFVFVFVFVARAIQSWLYCLYKVFFRRYQWVRMFVLRINNVDKVSVFFSSVCHKFSNVMLSLTPSGGVSRTSSRCT